MATLTTPDQRRMSFLRWALVTVPTCVVLGSASGLLSNSGFGNPWFDALQKPALMPPGWVFGAVWTTLYTLMGLALAMVLDAKGAPGRRAAIGLFGAQFVLNLGWSPLFFAQHQVTAAFWLIVAILGLTIATTFAFARIRRAAAWLLVPYMVWLGFAGVLNQRFDALNPGAETLAPAAARTQISLGG